MSMPNVAPPAEVQEQLLEQAPKQDAEQSLEEYDEEQVRLMEERCILVHPNDEAYGEASKKECHLMTNILPPRNLLHRAFSVFLFDPKTGKLLLQRRALEKITFPGMWTNTCCSHPLSIKGETEIPGQMGVRRAASRKLEHELGIPPAKTGPEQFTYLTRIHYLAPSDGKWGEHEVDYILFTTLDTEHTDNPNEVMDSCYVTKAELQAMFEDPALTFTPWFKLIARDFLFGWWDQLLSSPRTADGLLDARCAEFRALEDDKVWKM